MAALLTTPVKGLRIAARSHVRLEREGVAGDRLFYLVDERASMVNAKKTGGLQSVSADYDERSRVLTLTFPDGERVSAEAQLGEELQTRFYSSPRPARVVRGPFAQALSEHVGVALRLVAPADGLGAADRGADGAATLISSASLERLAEVAGERAIDARRFRMSVELDGPEPHGEDAWVGRTLQIGDARVAVQGHVGRCTITSRNPDSGALDLPTLDYLRAYRADLATSEPLAFGVHAAVLVPGVVRVGDEAVLGPLVADAAIGS